LLQMCGLPDQGSREQILELLPGEDRDFAARLFTRAMKAQADVTSLM